MPKSLGGPFSSSMSFANQHFPLGTLAVLALTTHCVSHSSPSAAQAPTPSAPRAKVPAHHCVSLQSAESEVLSIFKSPTSATSFLAQVYSEPLAANSDAEARAFMCKLFAPVVPSLPCTVGEGSFEATTDGLDGTWHVVGLPGDVFVIMYEPPYRGSEYPETTWTIRREGRFAIYRIVQSAFVCPSDTTQLCVSWSPHRQYDEEDLSQTDDKPREFFCPDEKALPCIQQGYNSEFYVVDPSSTRTVRIGPLQRADLPKLTAVSSAAPLTITTAGCSEEISF
jgi:hypothetical protein